MGKDVKNWSSEHQSALVLEIIRGETTVDAASKAYGVPASEIEHWIQRGIEGLENALKTDSLGVRVADDRSANVSHTAHGKDRRNQVALSEKDRSAIYKTVDEIIFKLASLYEGMGCVFEDIGSPQDLHDAVTERFDGGMTAFDFFDMVFFTYLSSKPPDCYIAGIVLAYAYCLESKKLLDQGDAQASSKSLATAIRYCKEAEKRALKGYETSERSAIARKGGTEKAKKEHDPIKQEMIRLLHEKRPPEGWKSRAAAIREILDDVTAYRRDRAAMISEERTAAISETLEAESGPHKKSEPALFLNLDRTLQKWLREDEGVRAAFEVTKKP